MISYMGNDYFRFKHFTINQGRCAFKVGTDGVLLGACADISGKERILDVGTGTGLIALMLAQRCDAEIIAIEPDNNSFLQASDNVKSSRWAGRIKVENCHLQNFSAATGRFDLIVTNPPYFIGSLKNADPAKSLARHNISLNHSDILEGADRLLADNGILQLIMPYAEGNIFIAEAQEHGLYCSTILKIRPTYSSEIRRLIVGFSRKKKKPAEEFLTIEKGRRYEFTDEYIHLTRDFYLHY